ncbi:MAG TPA: histidine kinase dimerization/phosphoacceptor domain -containing protein, partial [Candidatus Wallbacteria bacterium]|nr:histidine kinase dimerization/phosphoacceptor domain -containing protein [Candidatus Wallbacteria bacterium]
LLSKTFHEVTHPDDLEADVEHVSSLLTGKANTYQMEKRYIRRCGNIVYGLLSVSLVRTPEGAPRFFISQIVDISQRKLAENELNISRERLKSSLLEKEALLRELYHRTKNNMQVICAMLMLYSSQTNNLEAISAFREIDLKIRTMALVHKKLYESNDLSNINLKEYVHDLCALFEKSYGIISKQIELELNVEEISVTIDIAIPCGLVINELFSNTFKYAFPEGSQGKIKLDIKLTPEKYIDINYSDNGIGLPSGFDFRRDGRMGIQSIVSIIENQLQGSFSISSGKGFSCELKFKKSLYEIRV